MTKLVAVGGAQEEKSFFSAVEFSSLLAGSEARPWASLPADNQKHAVRNGSRQEHCERFLTARPRGVEPRPAGLEPVMLPVHQGHS